MVNIVSVLLLVVLGVQVHPTAAAGVVNTFTTGPSDQFRVNGTPINLRSGAFHYFRVPEPYWHERMLKLKNMGLNTLEFYIPWNLAETEKFSSTSSSASRPYEKFSHLRFARLAARMGFFLIARPGPYICAEWDFGGFPARLQHLPKLRTNYEPYLDEVRSFWAWLFADLRDELWVEGKGGTILMVQVENEWGWYGDYRTGDGREYMHALLDTAVEHLGGEVQFFTTDPPNVDAAKPEEASCLVKGCPVDYTYGSFWSLAVRVSHVLVEEDKFYPHVCRLCSCSSLHYTRTCCAYTYRQQQPPPLLRTKLSVSCNSGTITGSALSIASRTSGRTTMTTGVT